MSSLSSPLLSLPAELRLEVYSHFFSPTETLLTPLLHRSPLALALVCRQLYYETHELAFSATIFHTRAWRHNDIQKRLASVRLPYRSLIKRLEIQVGIYDFVRHPDSLKGLELAAAGLSGIQEIYISFGGQATQAISREANVIGNLVILLRKTSALCNNLKLKKIRVIHNGRLFWFGSSEIYEQLQRQLTFNHARCPITYRVEKLLQGEGQFSFVNRNKDAMSEHEVVVWIEEVAKPDAGRLA